MIIECYWCNRVIEREEDDFPGEERVYYECCHECAAEIDREFWGNAWEEGETEQ